LKKRVILAVLSIACILTSCTTTSTYEPPEVSYDLTTASASVAGFQVGMSARMAKRVAKQQGYSLSIHSDFTFDDIAEGRLEGANYIFLDEDYMGDNKRDCEQGAESVSLKFGYGRLESIHYECILCPRQEAEELLELYLTRYPQLTPLKGNEKEDFRSYSYKPNRFASLEVSIKMIDEKDWRVHISVHDRNYSQARRNYELYQKIEAIR